MVFFVCNGRENISPQHLIPIAHSIQSNFNFVLLYCFHVASAFTPDKKSGQAIVTYFLG